MRFLLTFGADRGWVRPHPVDGFAGPQMRHVLAQGAPVENSYNRVENHRIPSISLLITLLKSRSFCRSVSILRIE